jgi:hypothetical protein
MRVRFMIAIAIAIGVMTFGATMVFTDAWPTTPVQ